MVHYFSTVNTPQIVIHIHLNLSTQNRLIEAILLISHPKYQLVKCPIFLIFIVILSSLYWMVPLQFPACLTKPLQMDRKPSPLQTMAICLGCLILYLKPPSTIKGQKKSKPLSVVNFTWWKTVTENLSRKKTKTFATINCYWPKIQKATKTSLNFAHWVTLKACTANGQG